MNQDAIVKALDALAANDARVRKAIQVVGYPKPRQRPQGFWTLLVTIVNQQLSTHAAAAIVARLEAMIPTREAAEFQALSDDVLRTAGLSRQKIAYGRSIATAALAGQLRALPKLEDADALASLMALKGIGQWSAEIYAMFALGRTDLFPADDVALQESARCFLKLEQRPKAHELRVLAEQWTPHRTAMSLLLWHTYRSGAI